MKRLYKITPKLLGQLVEEVTDITVYFYAQNEQDAQTQFNHTMVNAIYDATLQESANTGGWDIQIAEINVNVNLYNVSYTTINQSTETLLVEGASIYDVKQMMSETTFWKEYATYGHGSFTVTHL